MEIKGNLSVEKWIIDSPYKIYDTQNNLNIGLTKIGSIGFFNATLWYRKDANSVIALATVEYLNSIINNLTTNINFTTIINNIISNALNVEVRSIKNKKILLAFNP